MIHIPRIPDFRYGPPHGLILDHQNDSVRRIPYIRLTLFFDAGGSIGDK